MADNDRHKQHEGAMKEKVCILLFVKSPQKGTVKSRLAKDIGPGTATVLYKNFVRDLLETLRQISCRGGHDLKIYYHPLEAMQKIRRWLGKAYRYAPQQGMDLGERMKNACSETFAEGYDRVLLLGSDTPDLPAAMIEEGCRRLQGGGAILGPADDGGYYLIGFRQDAFLPAVFAGIPWSSGDVLEKTMAIFDGHRWPVSLLPSWRDIDTLADLRDLQRRHVQDGFAQSHTMRYLQKVKA